jgi:biotin carboxyl carrier protein
MFGPEEPRLNDLSNLKAPGWQRVVAELVAPAPDDKLFLVRLISVLGQVSDARQAVFWTVPAQKDDPTEPKALVVWPLSPDAVDPQGRLTVPPESLFEPGRVNEATILNGGDARAAARAAGATRQAMLFGQGGEELMYDAGRGQAYILAVPVAAGVPSEAGSHPLHGVITLTVESRTRQALQTTLALVEVLAGYVFIHSTQQAMKRSRSASAALDLAARLLSAINSTSGFKGCTLQFVNDLCRKLAVDRVALGWVHGAANARRQGTNPTAGRRSVRLVALSDTENLDRRMAMAQKLESAMDECLDQEQTILYPPPPVAGPQADAVLSQAIVHAHKELASSDAKLKVASFPLRVVDAQGERILGVILVESGGDGAIELATIELIQATLDLVAPVLAVRHSDDRNLALRAADSAVKAGAWVVGPKHTVWKLVGVAVMVATACLFLINVTYRVGAPMELRPRERRTISVPYDGMIASLAPGIEPGSKVEKGQVMLDLDTTEMKLSELEAKAQVAQYETQADEARKKNDQGEVQQALAKAEQSRARADLFRHQIERARIVAPISGTIISGDLTDKVGAAIKLGEKLFEVADLSDMIVVAKVDDRDIKLIDMTTTGEVSPKADPSLKLPFTVEAIVPLAQAEEGQNAFEVRGKLANSPLWFRPGMEGQAKFNTKEHSVAWIASRRIIDQLKVWLWW